ncbi:hypothetical protein [Hoylesella shahii]|uniref:hypothetical protein n=1 Tax=Hoylesella shahii TaxID=228603 RepID=UPI001E61810A|nr:hypothetical protein [Hoylesella shahii]
MQLQSLEVSGDRQYINPAPQRQCTLETSLGADIALPLAEQLKLTGGLRATIYRSPDATFYGLDPLLHLVWQSPVGTFLVSGAIKRQYLFRTGFSSLNLPVSFGSHRRPFIVRNAPSTSRPTIAPPCLKVHLCLRQASITSGFIINKNMLARRSRLFSTLPTT